jgi:hypothetical protein
VCDFGHLQFIFSNNSYCYCLILGCIRNNCKLAGTSTSYKEMNITTCQETCHNVSDCTQWSWQTRGWCYLSKTLQGECDSDSDDLATTGQLSCPGINQTGET